MNVFLAKECLGFDLWRTDLSYYVSRRLQYENVQWIWCLSYRYDPDLPKSDAVLIDYLSKTQMLDYSWASKSLFYIEENCPGIANLFSEKTVEYNVRFLSFAEKCIKSRWHVSMQTVVTSCVYCFQKSWRHRIRFILSVGLNFETIIEIGT